jgi:hypothetical protein
VSKFYLDEPNQVLLLDKVQRAISYALSPRSAFTCDLDATSISYCQLTQLPEQLYR